MAGQKEIHRGKILCGSQFQNFQGWGSYSHKIGNNWFVNECIVVTFIFIQRKILWTETNSVYNFHIKKCQGYLLFIL